MTFRELWEGYLKDNVIEDMETPEEVALQKIAFLCGVVATLGTLAEGRMIDFSDHREILDEALAGIRLECDKHGRDREPSVN